MVISLEIFTDLNDGFDCGSVLNCGELVKGDFHMGNCSENVLKKCIVSFSCFDETTLVHYNIHQSHQL
jgi:hypothetical protein